MRRYTIHLLHGIIGAWPAISGSDPASFIVPQGQSADGGAEGAPARLPCSRRSFLGKMAPAAAKPAPRLFGSRTFPSTIALHALASTRIVSVLDP